jgi:uncharacterized membrane protein
MGGYTVHFLPIALPFFLALVLFFVFLVVLVELRVLQYTYEAIGVDRRYVFLLLLLSLLGSSINIPVAQLPPEQMVTPHIVDFFGMRYVVPAVTNFPGTVVAVNLGGALIPAIVSVYLILKNRNYLECLLSVAIVTWVVHAMAHPVPGVGIAVPIFIPPLATAAVALVVSRRYAAPVAYVAGSLGTLIGADLLNIGRIQGLGAPVASIGGAGKFDGIFLTGLIAVYLATLWRRRTPPAA